MSDDTARDEPIAHNQQLVIADLHKKLQLYEGALASMPMDAEDDDIIDLREYWNVLVRRRRTVFATIGLLAVVTLIATAVMTPIFRASTVIQIERESGKVLEYQNVTAEEAVSAKDFYQTQYELLRSRSLASRVIDKLGLQDSDSLNPERGKPGFLSGLVSSAKELVTGEVEADKDLPPDLEELFLENLTIQPVKNSRLVRLHYDSPDRTEAALVVNTLAASFVDMTLERRFSASTYAKGFLEERIKQIRADLEDSERAMVAYSQERGIINQNDKLGVLTAKLTEMNRTLVGVESQRFDIESQYQEMVGATDASMGRTLESLVVQQLKKQKTELQTEYEELLKIFKPAYPRMQQIQNKIDKIDVEMAKEVGNIREGMRIEYQSKLREEAKLLESIDKTRNEILSLQSRSTDFTTLKREVDTNRELYDGLLQRMKEVGVAAGISNNNIAVVDPAEVPRKRFKPSLAKNLAVALAIGLFLGVLLAFLFESLDDTIKSGAELEKMIAKPVIGTIPMVSGQGHTGEELALYAHESPTSAFAEAYRSMRTSLMFSTGDGAPKVMHFTSVNAGEGKTTTAVSTAVNFTQTGGNVLIIDADLRNPSLHKVFSVPNNNGLTNYLSGKSEPAEVTRKTGVGGLFVIPSGPVPPNPAELLSGAKMIELASLAAERFDYVIIDSPPLMGLADALILADVAKATLLVVCAGKTRKGALEAGLKRLRHTRANILGTVLSMVDMSKGSAGYGYDYHYSYSYGGGAEPETDEAKSQA